MVIGEDIERPEAVQPGKEDLVDLISAYHYLKGGCQR